MFIQNCFFFFLWKQINGKNELFLQKKRNPILSHFRNENRIVCSISISNRFRSCSAAIRQKSIFSIYFHDHCSLNAISSTIKEGKGRKIVADVLLRTSSLFLSRQMLIRVFLFVSLFFSFLCSFFIVYTYLNRDCFFFLLLFRSRDERLFWLERFQLIFPMVFHGKWRDIIIIYFLKWRKNWRKLLIFKLNIGFQIYRDVVSTFDQHLNYFFLRLLLHRKLFSKLFHG